MDNQNKSRQLRYLEEVRTPLHRAGFGTLPVEGDQLPVHWNGTPLCHITGKGSVFYRREDADTPQAEDALYRVEDIAGELASFALIAVNFPKFVDGRGYSTAALLRQRHGYTGELRAVGDVLHDQLFFMRRVGFDSYALKEGKSLDYAIAAGFKPFTEAYQGATDQAQPYFRRRA